MFEKLRWLRKFSPRGVFLLAALCGLFSVQQAQAGVIAGPPLGSGDGGWVYAGIGFTASVDSTLTGFTFQNEGLADTVILVDPLGNILDSIGTPAGVDSDTVSGLAWSLTAGHQYYLLGSTASNAMYATWNLGAPSDAEIALTDTGIFSYSAASASFGITGTQYWAAFNNITTGTGSAVPEPVSFLLGLPLAGLWLARRKR